MSTKIDNSIEDLNYLNFSNTNTLDDLPDIPTDEERMNSNPKRHLTPRSHSGSPSTSSKENDGGHFHGADVVASESERFADIEENIVNFNGDDLQDHSREGINQVNEDVQNLRRPSRPSVFPRNFNDFVVDPKDKYGLEKYDNYPNLNKGNYCFAIILNIRN
nr:ribonuclease H-like domain-containing protein [Tanacetum cinerariifolium]GFA21013.1 ribonuclease H-like domain-containing protein [Tanacetum cinerariifolium]